MFILKSCWTAVGLSFGLALASTMASAQTYDPPYPQREVLGLNAMVAAVDARAADIGIEVLRNGGNAVDAGVTVGFLMAVYEPWNSGLGGHGGHMAFYDAKSGRFTCIDASSKAPLQARPDMFADRIVPPLPERPGDVWRVKVEDEANAIGFEAMFAPTTVAQYAYLMQNHGSLSWREVLEPAIEVAEEGFVADAIYAETVNEYAKELEERGDPALYDPFIAVFQPGGEPLKEGQLVKLPQMANTLRQLAAEGADSFYQGRLGDRIVDWVRKNGGILSKEDFTSYRVETVELAAIPYRGYKVLTCINGANGSAISGALQILSHFDLRSMGFMSAEAVHVITEAMKLAFMDRYAFVSDRDFVPVPYDGLISWGYGRERAQEIDLARAQTFAPGDPWSFQQSGDFLYEKLGWSWGKLAQSEAVTRKEDTTFLTAVDRDRNMVLVTSSNQSGFGSGVVVPDLGFVLNSSMNNANPVPGHVLSIEPGKRILRNSGPVLVLKDDKPVMIMSAPGGRQIISSILTTLVNMVDYGLGPQAAIDAPRIHAEAFGNEVVMEEGVPEAVRQKLSAMEHEITLEEQWSYGGRMLAIQSDPVSGILRGGSEPRTHSGVSAY